MIELPESQLDAIAVFWAEQYLLEASEVQLQTFKAALKENVAREIQGCIWNAANPMEGSYLRARLTAVDYHPSPALRASLQAAGLKSGVTAFGWKTGLAIDPGKLRAMPSGVVIWQDSSHQEASARNG